MYIFDYLTFRNESKAEEIFFVGGLGGSDKCKQVNFENCTNNGNVTVTGSKAVDKEEGFIVMTGGFVGAVNGGKAMTATNCKNTGTITATNTLYPNFTKTVKGMTGSGIYEDGWVKVYAIYAGYNGQQ